MTRTGILVRAEFRKKPYRREFHVKRFYGDDVVECNNKVDEFIERKAKQGWTLYNIELDLIRKSEV